MSIGKAGTLVCLAILVAAVTVQARAEGAAQQQHCSLRPTELPGFEVARAIEKPAPKYPANALNDWSEGWALLEYAVTAAGTVRDVAIVDALGPADFAKSAQKAIATWRYAPAKLKGTPVDQEWYQTDVIYKIYDMGREADHEEFVRSFNRARGQIRDQRFSEAIVTLENAFKKRLNLYEEAMGSFALALAYAQSGDNQHALSHIRHATIDAGDYLDKGVRSNAAELEVELEALNGNFVDAVCTYERLSRIKGYSPTPTAGDTAQIVENIKKALADPKPLVIEAKLFKHPLFDVPAVWRHNLMRRKFWFANIKGEAKSFHLACVAASHDGVVDEETQWNVPDQAGLCMLRVDGAPDATFKLIEEN